MCVTMPNFVQIAQAVAEILQFIRFSRWRPSAKVRHRGHICTIFGVDTMSLKELALAVEAGVVPAYIAGDSGSKAD